MKRETLFLKVVVFLIGVLVLGLCIFLVPSLASWVAEEIPYLHYLVFSGFYATAIPFFFALYQTFASIVIAVFAAVLEKLLINAIDIKSENDLTV